MRVADISVAQVEGVPKKYVRKKIRKCKYCFKVLSKYNENEYCFAHIQLGWKVELANAANKKFESYQKHLKKMKALKKKKLFKCTCGIRHKTQFTVDECKRRRKKK